MGLFDFIRNIGKSISPGNEEAEIKKNITTLLGDQVENLTVKFDDGTVALGGQVETEAAKQKAVLLAGNIKGVEKVDDTHLSVKPKAKAASAPAPEPEFKFYEVKSGDSLSKIAKQFYGDALKWPTLFEANKEVIENPDLIYPGQKIRVPAKPA